MKLTLLVENNPEIESFYKLNLHTWLGLETVTQNSSEAASKYLETQSENINLIIVRCHIGKAQTAKKLMADLKIKALNIPVIVIGPGVVPEVVCVPNSLEIKILIKAAAAALNITAKEMAAKVVSDYFPIPVIYFKAIKRSVCPVYLRNNERFNLSNEKLIDFKPGFIDDLLANGIQTLYIDKMDRLDFVNNVTAELIAALRMEDLSEDENISAIDTSIELLSKKLLLMGINEETVGLAKKNIAAISETAKRNKQLSKLLERLTSNKASYLYKHTQILTYVSFHIIHNIDWGNSEQEEKISFIAFFHDLALEDEEQCRIHSTRELKNSTLSDEKKTLVEKHAQLSAEYITKFPHAPMGADQIIRQHHGQLHGLGFSDNYGANMTPMAIVFIVAEEFTRMIIANPDITLEEILKELRVVFTTNRFLKFVEKLETILV